MACVSSRLARYLSVAAGCGAVCCPSQAAAQAQATPAQRAWFRKATADGSQQIPGSAVRVAILRSTDSKFGPMPQPECEEAEQELACAAASSEIQVPFDWFGFMRLTEDLEDANLALFIEPKGSKNTATLVWNRNGIQKRALQKPLPSATDPRAIYRFVLAELGYQGVVLGKSDGALVLYASRGVLRPGEQALVLEPGTAATGVLAGKSAESSAVLRVMEVRGPFALALIALANSAAPPSVADAKIQSASPDLRIPKAPPLLGLNPTRMQPFLMASIGSGFEIAQDELSAVRRITSDYRAHEIGVWYLSAHRIRSRRIFGFPRPVLFEAQLSARIGPSVTGKPAVYGGDSAGALRIPIMRNDERLALLAGARAQLLTWPCSARGATLTSEGVNADCRALRLGPEWGAIWQSRTLHSALRASLNQDSIQRGSDKTVGGFGGYRVAADLSWTPLLLRNAPWLTLKGGASLATIKLAGSIPQSLLLTRFSLEIAAKL